MNGRKLRKVKIQNSNILISYLSYEVYVFQQFMLQKNF